MLLIELLVGGILLGGLYALLACGLNLIFGVMKIVNFAHGEFLAIAALCTVSFTTAFHLPYFASIIIVPAGMAALGYCLQKFVLRHLTNSPLIMSLLATYAVSTILVSVSIAVWGGSYRGMPDVLTGSISLFGLNFSESRVVGFVTAMTICLVGWWMLQSTRFGRAIRAVSAAPELATISGISIERVRNLTFALGAAMAGLAGVLLAPSFASDPQMGSRFLVKAFAVIIIGGMGSYPGAIMAALFLGVAEVLGGYYYGQILGMAIIYLLMLVVLLVRPRGLMGIGSRV